MIEQTNYSLLPHNTFGIEAKAAFFITYTDVADLQVALRHVHECHAGKPLLHIGGGSNLLFLSDFEGVVLHSRITGIEVAEEADSVLLKVGAGMVWDEFVAFCVERGFYGVENLSLIPGEVGAAAVQNIGAYGAEAKDVITEVEAVDLHTGEFRVFSADECRYGYRRSIFKNELRGRYAVTHVCFRLSRRFVPNLGYGGVHHALAAAGYAMEQVTAEEVRKVIIAIRREKLPDPAVKGNAGSFFMNPVVEHDVYERLASLYPDMPCYEAEGGKKKIPAGWLIEQCGWKGRSLGAAAVHERQALVLVNNGGATGADILRLCDAVRKDVHMKFGIEIRPEVNFIGKLS